MRRRSIMATILCIVMVFSFAACSGSDALATVGSSKITDKEIETYSAMVAIMSGATYEELDETTKAYLSNSVLLWLADKACIEEHFKNEGKDVITEEDQKEIDTNSGDMLESLKSMAGENELSRYGITEKLLKSYIEAQYYDDAFREEILEADPVTDEEAEKYYEENKDSYVRTSKSVTTSHVLIGDSEHKAEDLELAEQIKARALAGEDFAALATEYSKDAGSAANGGDIGENDETSSLVDPYKNAMLALAEGQISDVVESEFGYHIIKATKVNEPGQKAFDEVKDEIVAQLEQQRVLDAYPGLREETSLKWSDKLKLNEETGLPEPVLPEEEPAPETDDSASADDGSGSEE
ncbi:MAG: peptidylprolyl isomerase [Clostridiales Family XIII bacterium]|nr:peptidylprolyl isomerase [Clostridiales Family XIII bacterium]